MGNADRVLGFPIWLIAVAVLVTVAALGWLSWGAYKNYHSVHEIGHRLTQLGNLRGEIIYLDEVLTMSARMTVASGDAAWIKRHKKYAPKLDAIIKKTIRLSGNPEIANAAYRTDKANIKLVEMESYVFHLIEENRIKEAQAILYSAAYENQKSVYAEGMTELLENVQHQTEGTLKLLQRHMISGVVGALIVLFVVLPVWLLAARRIKLWHTSLLQNIARRKKAELALEAEEKLRKSEFDLAKAQRMAHLGNWELDLATNKLYWSDEAFRIFEIDPKTFDGSYETFLKSIHPEDREMVNQVYSNFHKEEMPCGIVHRLLMPDGRVKYVEESYEVILDEHGNALRSIGTIQEITEKKEAELALFEEKERAQVTLRSIGDAVISTDGKGIIEFLNSSAETLTGWSARKAEGQPLQKVFRIINEETRKPVQNPVMRCLEKGKIIGLANHTVLVSRSGKEYAIESSAAPIRSAKGILLGVVLVFKDVTQARHLSKKLIFQASHDELTGLINRREFKRLLKRVQDTAHSEATENALCYLDLDQFKLINDTSGHVAGDEVLRQLGQLLKKHIRRRDTLARLGGDEFGLLMEHCSVNEARQVAENLIKVVGDFSFSWEGHSFSIGVSVGLVAVNIESDGVDGVLSAADSACYVAKEQGRNRVHFHQAGDEKLAIRRGEMQWAVRLPRALAKDSFQLYFQEIMPLEDDNYNQVSHYELLLRMKGDEGKLSLPGNFLPAAERYNLSDKLDRWVINHAFSWFQNHPSHLEKMNICSINLSGSSLSNKTFLPFVIQALESSGIPSRKICFEITETSAIVNLTSATTFIKELKQLGCRFALDDFGSGFSSFAYLKNLPVDFLKIDGMFVKDILDDPIDLAMVKSINEIGHVMGKQTIAEFVENDAILERLREIGVDYAQGYGIGKPRPLNGLLKN